MESEGFKTKTRKVIKRVVRKRNRSIEPNFNQKNENKIQENDAFFHTKPELLDKLNENFKIELNKLQ